MLARERICAEDGPFKPSKQVRRVINRRSRVRRPLSHWATQKVCGGERERTSMDPGSSTERDAGLFIVVLWWTTQHTAVVVSRYVCSHYGAPSVCVRYGCFGGRLDMDNGPEAT